MTDDDDKLRAHRPRAVARLRLAVQRWRHTLLGAALTVAVVAGVGWWYGVAPRALPAAPPTAVEVPVRPVAHHAPEDAERVIVTLRWGHTTGSPTDAAPTALGTAWDGYLALDCGDIERVETLGIEAEAATTDAARRDPSDRMGPVVRGDEGDQRVYWRSRTHNDWDGLRATLAICRSDVADGASTLRIVTPQKTYVARLDWSVDDFVSLHATPDGGTLDVHMASTRDRRRVPEARVTQGPADARSNPVATAAEGVEGADTVTPPVR